MYITRFTNCIEGGMSFEEVKQDQIVEALEVIAMDGEDADVELFMETISELVMINPAHPTEIAPRCAMSAYGCHTVDDDSYEDELIIIATDETAAAIAFFEYHKARESAPTVDLHKEQFTMGDNNMVHCALTIEGELDSEARSILVHALLHNTKWEQVGDNNIGCQTVLYGLLPFNEFDTQVTLVIDEAHKRNGGGYASCVKRYVSEEDL